MIGLSVHACPVKLVMNVPSLSQWSLVCESANANRSEITKMAFMCDVKVVFLVFYSKKYIIKRLATLKAVIIINKLVGNSTC